MSPDYFFLPPEAFLDALRGFTFLASSLLISTFTWVAKLQIPPGTPVGQLVRTSFDQNDRPVEVYVVILPGDKHVLLYDVDAS